MKRACVLNICLAVAAPALLADEPAPEGLTRAPLLERQIELPTNRLKTNLLRVTLAQGYKTPLHTHEGPGPRYVLKGQVRMEEGGEAHVYGPGEVFWETGTWMTIENVGQGEAELLIVELTSPK